MGFSALSNTRNRPAFNIMLMTLAYPQLWVARTLAKRGGLFVVLRPSGTSEILPRMDSAPSTQSRFDEIYLAVSTLFLHQKGAFADHERNLAADILRRVSKDVEMSIRIALAERLADDPAAPHDLINLLCDDTIEVARPILARSPVLSDADLVRVIENGSEGHQISVAARPAIGETVTATLARHACEAAVIALLRNGSAKIARSTFEHLNQRARSLPAIQKPLIECPDLPGELARQLYLWVSDALKAALVARHPDAARTLVSAIDETTAASARPENPVASVNARKLVEKLHASGQLRASFLIRVLNQGEMEMFEYAFAALLNMEPETMRKALYGEDAMRVALACRAAGIDRSVFQTVFNLSRHHRRVTAQLSDSDRKEIEAIFSQLPKTEALQILKAQAA
jgi:uncharacterized protein (DUF2336 family)